MPHSSRKLLLDVSLSCREINEFTKGKTYDDFLEDRLLVGARNPKQVKDNAGSMDFTLSQEELDQITKAADEFELA